AVDVDGLPALLGELDRELDREAVRRNEHERLLAGDHVLAGERLELLQPARERFAEALLLEPDDSLDLVSVLGQLWVHVAHLLDDDARQTVDAVEPDPLPVLHRAPDDAS